MCRAANLGVKAVGRLSAALGIIGRNILVAGRLCVHGGLGVKLINTDNMKFNVSGKALQQQAVAVNKVINSKNALTILDNFLLRVEGDRLYITGSDQENVMTAWVGIMESEGDGRIAVSAKRLLDILKEVSDQGLQFYINDETREVDIRFLNGHFSFTGVDPDEYPVKAELDAESAELLIPSSVVQKGIENTLFAVSTDTIRPIMTGIFWDIHHEDITFVSSDTHKLVRYVNTEAKPGMTTSFIMPSKPAAILRSLIQKEDGEVRLTMDTRSATFEFGVYSLSCRFINGIYPNYNRVIPESNPFELTCDRQLLLSAMRRVSLFASAASSLVRLNIHPDEVLLSSQDLDYATSAEERLAVEYKGNSMVIGFNAGYMIEVLNALHGDELRIQLSDPSRPGIFLPVQQDAGDDVLMLLMPMQTFD